MAFDMMALMNNKSKAQAAGATTAPSCVAKMVW